MNSDDGLDIEQLAASASARLARRMVELAPRSVLNDESVDWDGAIVFVTAGEIELVCASGACARFQRGDILCFAPFPGRTVRNRGAQPARLLAIWRQQLDSDSGRTG
jgi:glyoxylate utilization-related uncharacterized protein